MENSYQQEDYQWHDKGHDDKPSPRYRVPEFMPQYQKRLIHGPYPPPSGIFR